MVLIGLSSSYYAFKGKSIYFSVKSVRDQGFNLCELGAAHAFEPNVWDIIKRTKKDFPDIDYSVHGFFPPMEKRFWFNPSLGMTSENKKVIDGLFRTAEITEAVAVGIHPGFLGGVALITGRNELSLPKKTSAIPKEKALSKLFTVLRVCSKKAKDLGIKFVIENIGCSPVEPLVYSAQDFREVFTEFPDTGLLLDLGHALYCDNLDDLLELHSQIMEVHIHFSHLSSGSLRIDEHLPIPDDFNFKKLAKIEQLSRIPLVFEHGSNVSEQEIIEEKKLLEKFLRQHGAL